MNAWLTIVTPILALVSSISVAVIVARRGKKSDEFAKQAGDATRDVASFGQVVDGLNKVIVALQEDNKILREDVGALRSGVELCRSRIDVLEVGGTELQAKVREQEREIAVLHFENDALKVENQKLLERIDDLEKANGKRQG